MIRQIFATIALIAAAPLAAQTINQDEIDARYDRALAAGYKALMLCSAIANAERNGATRTPESVENWELAGIQRPLDEIVPELTYEIERFSDGNLAHVEVSWSDSSRARIADHDSQKGCYLLPINGELPPIRTSTQRPPVQHAVIVEPSAGMAALFTGAFAEQYGLDSRTTAVVVLRDGKVTGEQYVNDFRPNVPQRTWSVAKSIAATLVGTAVHRGEISVSDRAKLGYFSTDLRTRITLDHLLRMASGRYSDTPGNRTDPLYFGGSTVEESALHWPAIFQPGTVFRYANNDTLAAVKAIDADPAELFDKLEMGNTVAEKDWRRDYILSSQVWSTARDLAKLGQLYLNDGVLPSGERILPENWLDYVSTPSGPQPDGPFGYGAGFWLLNKSEGVPADTIAAMGNRGQYVVIVPSRNVVIVRRGEDPVGSRFDIAAFTRDVLENMSE